MIDDGTQNETRQKQKQHVTCQYAKFQENRAIEWFSNFSGRFSGVGAAVDFQDLLFRRSGPYCTKFGEDIERYRCVPPETLIPVCCCFVSKWGSSKTSGVELSRPNFALFTLPPLKIRGGMSAMSPRKNQLDPMAEPLTDSLCVVFAH